mgnify:FL=1
MTTTMNARLAIGALALAFAGACWAQAGFDDSASARLLVAARGNDLPAVQRALAEGGSVNARSRIGETVNKPPFR